MEQYQFYYEEIAWQDAESIFVQLYGEKKHAFWLDSSKVEKGVSRFSYMGKATSVTRYSLNDDGEDIFSTLEKKLQTIRVDKTSVPFDFVGGYVGYFGYELKKLCGFSGSYQATYPDSLWYFVDRFLVFDHEEKVMYLACLATEKKDAESWFSQIKEHVQSVVTIGRQNEKRNVSKVSLQLGRDRQQYLNDIDVCKKYLKDGESYEICLTNTLTTQIKQNPLDLYRSLRKNNPAPFAAFMRDNYFSILCSSPERFLHIDHEGLVESKPIKGTIKRSADNEADKKLAKQLASSEKDRAENLMIVDLVRNDLGKVCAIGSVHVSKLMAIETFQTVHHLVSTVRGKLRSEISRIACIKACFPGGSMTGAPKKRTIEIIDRLEKQPRGVYSGALGFLSANGTVDLNIVNRTMVITDGKLSIGVGGAITIQSDPQKEYEEMLLKAEALKMSLRKS